MHPDDFPLKPYPVLCSQLLACVGMIAWKIVAVQNNFLGQVLTFTLLYTSLYSTYMWPGESSECVFEIKKNVPKPLKG